MNVTIVLGGKEFQAAPLRLRQVREISQILSQRAANPTKAVGYAADVQCWVPFMVEALKINHPDITSDAVEEATLQEFNDAWTAIVSNSGVTIKQGESIPKVV